MGLVEHHLFGGHGVVLLQVVAETAGNGFEHSEGICVSLLFGGVATTGRERNGNAGCGLDTHAACEDDGVGHASAVCSSKRFEHAKHLRELGWLVGFPVLLRSKSDASAVGSAAHVGATERGSAGPSGLDHFTDGKPAGFDGVLEGVDIVRSRAGRNGVLPNEVFFGDIGSEVPCLGAHVAVKKFEPCSSESVGEHVGVLVEVLRNLPVGWISNHGHVGGGHHGWNLDGRVFCIGRQVFFVRVLRRPLMSAGRTLGQHPRVVVLEQQIEVTVVPLGGVGSPRAFDAAGDGVSAFSGAVRAGPAEALLFDAGPFGLSTNVGFLACAVCLSEGVAAGRQGDGFFVVHGHSSKGLADVLSAQQRVGVGVGALWVDVNQSHLDSGQGILEVLAGVAVAVVT